ncbi:choice-of-anchor Q domain-containing protein [Candidatus Margulisiibacteriota bacterium]
MFSSTSFAANLIVPYQYPTIQEALNNAAQGDLITVEAGIYNEYGITWSAYSDVVLRGAGTGLTTIDALGLGRAISVESVVALTIEALTITRGVVTNQNGGGIFLAGGATLEMISVVVSNCSTEASGDGGAIHALDAHVYAYDCEFRNNIGVGSGGVSNRGTWTAINCIFSGNYGINGGVTYGDVVDFSVWYVENCIFSNNRAGNSGGVVLYPNWTATNCAFVGNVATSNGGVLASGIINAEKCTFIDNSSTAGSGGCFSYSVAGGTTNYLTNCVFAGNSADSGLGGVIHQSKSVVKNCSFYGNSASVGDVVGRAGYGYVQAMNSIFWGNDDPLSGASVANLLQYCDVEYEDWTDFPNQTLECISADPIFVSTSESSGHLLQLEYGSPCIDTGTFESMPSDDILGQSRPWGPRYDMGAYEYHGGYAMINSPNGGETYYNGQTIGITWQASDEYALTANPITLRFSDDDGASWTLIAGSLANTGTYSWLITSESYANCLISIEAVSASSESRTYFDASDAVFEVIQLSTVYVSTSGSDSTGTGTIEAPFRTIQKGLNVVASPGTVEAFGGTYNEYDIIWPDSENITLKASTESSVCTIDALSLGRIFNVSSAVDLTIEGITLQNGKVNNLTGGGILLTGGVNLRLIDVTIKACTEEANNYGGAVYANNSTIEAQNCIFDGNYAYGGGGVGAYGSWIVTDCIFKNNSVATGPGGGVAFQGDWNATNCVFNNNSSAYYGGIASQGIWTATNCVFFGNSAVEGGGVARLATWTVVNCVFFDNSAGNNGGVAYQGTWNGRNSIFWGNTAGGTGPVFNGVSSTVKYSDSQTVLTGDGNINVDPLFVSTDEADTGNFLRIGSYSPCIDSASTEAPSPDLAGNVRPHGLNNDMGAYEFQGPSISVEAPNGGEELKGGSVYQITWKATDEIYGIMPNSITIEYSIDDGATWIYITTEAYAGLDGSYDWTVPILFSDTCLISIEVTNASAEPIVNHDISNASFTILNPIVYVSTSGSDETGTGTIEAPFKTIQKGLDSVAATGEVRVMTGLYTGEAYDTYSMIGWPDRPDITLMISPGATGPVTIDAGANTRRCIDVPNPTSLTIEGITLQKGNHIPSSCRRP